MNIPKGHKEVRKEVDLPFSEQPLDEFVRDLAHLSAGVINPHILAECGWDETTLYLVGYRKQTEAELAKTQAAAKKAREAAAKRKADKEAAERALYEKLAEKFA